MLVPPSYLNTLTCNIMKILRRNIQLPICAIVLLNHFTIEQSHDYIEVGGQARKQAVKHVEGRKINAAQ